MPKDDTIEISARVCEVLPHSGFKVQLESGQMIQAYVSGKMKIHNIRVAPGDRVMVEITPYDLTRGRIMCRMDRKAA